jgi:hypothetical protein
MKFYCTRGGKGGFAALIAITTPDLLPFHRKIVLSTHLVCNLASYCVKRKMQIKTGGKDLKILGGHKFLNKK